jgi:ATP-dependent RNA helicase DeaD
VTLESAQCIVKSDCVCQSYPAGGVTMRKMVDLLSTVEEPETTTFKKLGIHENTLQTLENIGYHTPSPIQAGFIPIAVTGKDCTGQARTGTGKTAAFILPTLERIDLDEKAPTQAIVLAPTRELSEQVAVEAQRLAGGHTCRVAVLVGGRPINKQMDALRKGVQIAVGTPGRVIDLLNRRALDLSQVKVAILDEADRMLDIGFRPDIEKILRRCPTERQTLLLSATMPAEVERLAKKYMRDPQRVDLSEGDIVVDTVDQYYATVDNDRKFGMLVKILAKERPQQALVFMRTKRGVERLYQRLVKKLPGIAMMNGDMHQSKRDRVMRDFRAGKVRMLVATDVVGRGIDVSGISHIINYDIPEYHDDYVHRVGRTGRLSSAEKGVAITFVMRDQGEQLTNIEKRINRMLPEYKVDDFKAFQPRAPRPTVEDKQDKPEVSFA